MNKMLAVFVVFVATAALSQTRAPIRVDDASAAGSPVALSGTLSFEPASNPTKAVLRVSGQNLTDRGIMAVLITIDALPLFNFREEHDHFFKQIEITPRSRFGISGGGPIEFPFGKETINGRQAPSPVGEIKKVEARAVWVQFEDGSTWGDESAGETMRAERVEMRNFFVHLLDVHRQSGERGLLQELASPHHPGSITESLAMSFQQLQQTHGTAALVDHINQRLALGASRSEKQ